MTICGKGEGEGVKRMGGGRGKRRRKGVKKWGEKEGAKVQCEYEVIRAKPKFQFYVLKIKV